MPPSPPQSPAPYRKPKAVDDLTEQNVKSIHETQPRWDGETHLSRDKFVFDPTRLHGRAKAESPVMV